MKKRAVIYARVSTKEQDTNYSIPSQIDEAKGYAQRNDIDVVGTYHEDASGFRYPREKLEIALGKIENNEADVLLCHTEDRLNRHEINGFLIRQRLVEAKAELHYTLSGRFDLGDEYRMYAMIKDAVSAAEARSINERMSRGRRYKAKGGAWIGLGAPPYGYRVVGEKRETRLEINEDEARWVRQVFEWYVTERLSVRKIIKQLTALGVERPGVTRQDGHAKAGASQWNDATIYKMLKNTTYIGVFYSHKYSDKRTPQGRIKTARPREEWLEIATPPIIDEDIFNKAQLRLQDGKSASFKNRKYDYLMATRLYCSLCGYKITPLASKPGKLMYYKCRSHEWRVWEPKCALPFFRVEKVDGLIWERIAEYLEHPESLRRAAEEARATSQVTHSQKYESIATIEAEIVRQKAKLQKSVSLYLDTSGDSDQRFINELAKRGQDEANAALVKLHHERDLLLRQIAESQVSEESIAAVEEFAREVRLAGSLSELSMDTRRAVVDYLGATAVLAVEDGQKIVYLTILLHVSRLVLDGGDSSDSSNSESGSSLRHKDTVHLFPSLTFRLVLAA